VAQAEDLRRLRGTWERLGRENPMSAVQDYSDDWDQDRFCSTGGREVDGVIAYLEGLGLPTRRDRALDFGCGLGRVSGIWRGISSRSSGSTSPPR
jgi:hypothetical protein